MDTTTSAPTRQPRSRTKPVRHVRLCIRPEGTSTGVMRITVGEERADYFLTALPADFGHGFQVEKIGLHENEPPYHVNIDADRKTCECKGFLRHGHCKHSDGLAALIAAGRL